jgi:hypothetical protein
VFEQIAANFEGMHSLEIRERLDEYRLICEGINLSPQVALLQTYALLSKTKDLPLRDRFELQLSFHGDSVSVTDASQAGHDAVSTHLQQHVDPGEVRLELIVRKREERTLSIYSLSAFGAYLQAEKLAIVLAALNVRFQDGIDFECLCPVSPSGSATIRFWPHGTVPATHESSSTNRSNVLDAFRDNSYSSGFKGELIPSDFHLLQRTNNDALDGFMDKACAVLCATYLANSSQVVSPERLSYKLIGYKAVEGEAAFIDFVAARPHLYKIYDWAYGAGGSSDRIGLARNVVSLHVNQLQAVADDATLWNAIHSNYQIYLKGNVASYLEVKSKITEFLAESTARAHALVEDLIDSLKNSVFVLLTFVLTVVVVNGFKDTGAAVIFSVPYVWIVVILCIVLTVWIAGTCFGLLRRFDNSAETTASIMQLGYSKILLSSEISDSVGPINARNRQYLVKQCWRYAIYWLVIALLLTTGFVVGNRVIGRTQAEPHSAQHAGTSTGAPDASRTSLTASASGTSSTSVFPSKTPATEEPAHSTNNHSPGDRASQPEGATHALCDPCVKPWPPATEAPPRTTHVTAT